MPLGYELHLCFSLSLPLPQHQPLGGTGWLKGAEVRCFLSPSSLGSDKLQQVRLSFLLGTGLVKNRMLYISKFFLSPLPSGNMRWFFFVIDHENLVSGVKTFQIARPPPPRKDPLKFLSLSFIHAKPLAVC